MAARTSLPIAAISAATANDDDAGVEAAVANVNRLTSRLDAAVAAVPAGAGPAAAAPAAATAGS
jgi:hypothetical protein